MLSDLVMAAPARVIYVVLCLIRSLFVQIDCVLLYTTLSTRFTSRESCDSFRDDDSPRTPVIPMMLMLFKSPK